MANRENKTQWTVVATATNGAANAVKAALAGHRHYITGYTLSSRGGTPAAVTVTVESGAVVKDQVELPNAVWAPIPVNYVAPIECGINETAEVNLPALGASIVGTAVIRGYTLAE